jgi:hypothetical protein
MAATRWPMMRLLSGDAGRIACQDVQNSHAQCAVDPNAQGYKTSYWRFLQMAILTEIAAPVSDVYLTLLSAAGRFGYGVRLNAGLVQWIVAVSDSRATGRLCCWTTLRVSRHLPRCLVLSQAGV